MVGEAEAGHYFQITCYGDHSSRSSLVPVQCKHVEIARRRGKRERV